MQNVFEPTVDELKFVTADKGVDILRDLLHAVGVVAKINPTDINVPFAINVADGGVDAEVNASEINESVALGIVVNGINRYQVKTGNFSISTPSDRKELLLKPSSRSKRKLTTADLHDRVRHCLENNGTLVLVFFGNDSPEKVDGADVKLFLNDLIKINPAFKNAKIKIWKANIIAKLLGKFPAISLPIKGIRAPGFIHEIEYMKSQCHLMGDYLEPESHSEIIREIRSKINTRNGLTHIRILGEPGIGKTRLVYEALNSPSLKTISLYSERPHGLFTHDLISQLRNIAEAIPLIVVVDECSAEHRYELHRRFENINSPVTLITIYNEIDELDSNPENFFLVVPPGLPIEMISNILQSYKVVKEDADHIAQHFCSGSPRVAHIVGQSLLDNPGSTQLTKSNGIEDIWKIYIAPRHATPEMLRVRKLVATHLALFKKFGWNGTLRDEAKLIHKLINDFVKDPITWPQFKEVIDDLTKRRILQGYATLYITPKLLHIKLWSDWFNEYRDCYDIKKLLEAIKDSPLKKWFIEMVSYIKESQESSNYFEELIMEDGIFNELSDFNDNGNGSLFIKLAQFYPKAAVRAISRALANSSIEELTDAKSNRRTLVHSLEKIALFGDCFIDAAECLCKLAQAENEKWGNNATGVFIDLFSLGYGELASTELPPNDRLPVLIQYLNSDNKVIRALALKAFDNALRISVSRWLIRGRTGLNHDPKGWMPQTHLELHDIYKTYLNALWQARSNLLDKCDKKTIATIILGHARTFFSIKSDDFNEIFLKTLEALAEEDQDVKSKVIETIVSILRYDKAGLSPTIAKKIKSIHDRISETTFSSKMHRYVGLNLLEDRYSRDGTQTTKMDSLLSSLANSALNDLPSFENELSWLVTNEAKNGFEFGKKLGSIDIEMKVWLKIKNAWLAKGEHASDFFIGGYLSGVFERNESAWENCIQQIRDSSLSGQIPFLVSRSGMTSNIAELLYDTAKKNIFDPSLFGIFIYGGVVKNIPSITMLKILELMLLKGNKQNVHNALEIIGSLIHNKYMPEITATNLCYEILSHPVFFTKSDDKSIGSIVEYNWSEVAISLAKQNITKGINLLNICISNLGEDGTIVDSYKSDAWKFLNYVTQQSPDKVWPLIAQHLDPLKANGFTIVQWLSEGLTSKTEEHEYPTFNSLPRKDIFSWIDEKPKTRAITMAHFAPFSFSQYGETPKSFIREVLERYGSSLEVRQAISANYNTGSWWGSASGHFGDKLQHLEEFKSTEIDTNVLRWLNEEISNLKDAIQQAKIREERED